MKLGAFFAGLALAATACGGEASLERSPGDGRPDGPTLATSQCIRPSAADAAAEGCVGARALVSCSSPNGGCSCLSDDPTTCAGCKEQLGADVVCESKCAPNEYAMSCGGPPRPGGGTYQVIPKECYVALITPGRDASACCPCQ